MKKANHFAQELNALAKRANEDAGLKDLSDLRPEAPNSGATKKPKQAVLKLPYSNDFDSFEETWG
jgi:hypothetical protein